MANLSLSQQRRLSNYKGKLELYLKAEEAILDGQSYSLGSRSLTRANLKNVQDMIWELERKIDDLEARSYGKGRTFRVIPRDH